MKTLSLTALLFLAPSAFAAPGVQEPTHPNYKNALDMTGLCISTQGNDKNHYWQSGHCLSIWESLTKNDCISKKVEEIRLRIVGDSEQIRAAGGQNTNAMNFGLSCTGKNDPTKDNMSEIAKNKDKFNVMMMQLFSLIAIEQSNWQVNQGGSANNQQEVKCEKNCGLLGINKSDMEKPEYACGCEVPQKTDDQKQYDPTMDGHLNLRCGITIALFEATKDKENTNLLGDGRPKGQNREQDSRTGLARVFKSLEHTDDDDDSSDDPTKKFNTPRKRIAGKMKTYCDFEAHSNRSTRELPEQLSKQNGGDGDNELNFPRSDGSSGRR